MRSARQLLSCKICQLWTTLARRSIIMLHSLHDIEPSLPNIKLIRDLYKNSASLLWWTKKLRDQCPGTSQWRRRIDMTKHLLLLFVTNTKTLCDFLSDKAAAPSAHAKYSCRVNRIRSLFSRIDFTVPFVTRIARVWLLITLQHRTRIRAMKACKALNVSSERRRTDTQKRSHRSRWRTVHHKVWNWIRLPWFLICYKTWRNREQDWKRRRSPCLNISKSESGRHFDRAWRCWRTQRNFTNPYVSLSQSLYP